MAPVKTTKDAEAEFTTGNRGGTYKVTASLKEKLDYPYTCKGYIVLFEKIFEVYVAGVDMSAKYDGTPNTDKVETFIGNIPAQNELT